MLLLLLFVLLLLLLLLLLFLWLLLFDVTGEEKSIICFTSISFRSMSSISSGILPPVIVRRLDSIDKFKYFDDLLMEFCELCNLIVDVDELASNEGRWRWLMKLGCPLLLNIPCSRLTSFGVMFNLVEPSIDVASSTFSISLVSMSVSLSMFESEDRMESIGSLLRSFLTLNGGDLLIDFFFVGSRLSSKIKELNDREK